MLDFETLCARLGVPVPAAPGAITAPADVTPVTPEKDQRAPLQQVEERAAIAEYDGRIPRIWAEGFARLQLAPCPSWIDPRRWWRMLDDAGRFLDDWGYQLAALGWTTEELFGIDEAAPLRRVDLMGLAWIIDGFRVVAVTRDTATLEHQRTNRRQSYRRTGQAGRPLWEVIGSPRRQTGT